MFLNTKGGYPSDTQYERKSTGGVLKLVDKFHKDTFGHDRFLVSFLFHVDAKLVVNIRFGEDDHKLKTLSTRLFRNPYTPYEIQAMKLSRLDHEVLDQLHREDDLFNEQAIHIREYKKIKDNIQKVEAAKPCYQVIKQVQKKVHHQSRRFALSDPG